MFRFIKYSLSLALLTFVFFPLLFIVQYVHPITDDYGFAMSTNIWKDTWTIYLTMDNRLVGNFLTILFCNSNNIFFHRLELLLFIIILFFSIYLVFNTINKFYLNNNPSDVFLLFSLFCFLYVSFNPGIAEAFFWHPGVVIWSSSILFVNLLVVLLLNYIHTNKNIYFILICIIIFTLVLQNEIMLVFLAFISLVLIFYYFKCTNLNNKKDIKIVLIVLACGGVIAVLGPGNYLRLKYISSAQPTSWIHLIKYNFLIYRKLLFLSSLVVFNILLIPFYYDVTIRIKKYIKPSKLLLLSAFILLLMTLPSIIAKTLYTFRIQNVMYYFVVIIVVVNFLNISIFIRERGYVKIQGLNSASLIMCGFLVVTYVMQKESTLRTVYSDLITQKASIYSEELTNRYTLIRTSKRDTVYVMPLTYKPKSLFVDDITDVPTDWRNSVYSTYFKKKAIITNQ